MQTPLSCELSSSSIEKMATHGDRALPHGDNSPLPHGETDLCGESALASGDPKCFGEFKMLRHGDRLELVQPKLRIGDVSLAILGSVWKLPGDSSKPQNGNCKTYTDIMSDYDRMQLHMTFKKYIAY